ncbi:Trehalose-6-phosphate phosphatase [Carbonactinospora thermoautotrophica]|uniref:Trehalose 6-phosphate phosphatase n=1 Tax=Carbonactinospora thermoautotrophica TaxID=1469144 RepID=A0A132MZ22_9ACTN|nr:trehalose-phosphatase [Carbonactinospora thermoautotrophica]KWX02976.1 Trehalose-6-phosphate phosphatase [Carbonactinospora thermoautotrophica]
MPVPQPTTPEGAAGLAALLADPARAVIALDFDGTLAPIVEDPTQARAHPGAVPALTRLAPRVDSIVVITGRPAATAVEYGGFAGVPGLVVLGHYGRERWEAATGQVVSPDAGPGVAAVRAALPGVLRAAGAPEGTWIEDKGSSLAVHTRRAADPEGALALLAEPLATLAAQHGLVVEPGRMVLELRPPGVDKGAALTAYVRERKAGCVLFAGDDLGDLAAYAAVDALRAEGVPGLKVCSGSAEVRALAERADLVVDGPDGVVALLEEISAELAARERDRTE